jgi:glutamine phosphoribosylpyrophosphate amidotransferase
MVDEAEFAAAHRSVEEMREHVFITSLHYLSPRRDAVGDGDPEEDVCRACFTRSYPTRSGEGPRRSTASSRPARPGAETCRRRSIASAAAA